MDILKTIDEAWGWKGIKPISVVDTNAFGNVIVRTASGQFWRICPEELRAVLLADSEQDYDRVREESEFIQDWNMAALVEKAKKLLGTPSQDRCYCLKIPGVMGGEYSASNLSTIRLSELLSASGSLAKQIDGLPDGSKVRLIVK